MSTPVDIEITGPRRERFDEVLTPEALDFLAMLHRAFDGRRLELLEARTRRYDELAAGGTLDFGVARESTRSSAVSGPVSGNSRVPWPTTAGTVSRVISSTSWLSNSQRLRLPLPCTCSSPAGLAFSSPMAAATSPERTVVFAQRGSVSVVDARYLGCVFKAPAMGLMPGSSTAPQEPAKIS